MSYFAELCVFATLREPIGQEQQVSRKGAKTQSSAKTELKHPNLSQLSPFPLCPYHLVDNNFLKEISR